MTPATILVVEDNPVSRKMVRLALESRGYTVLEASSGQAAVELVADRAPDLVLQDLVLPDIEGSDLVKRLRALPRGADIPIIAFSGMLSKMEAARSLQIGFTDYLFKPADPSHLLEIVEGYLAPMPPFKANLGRGKRVLIVDDDPVSLKIAALQIGQLGFAVTTARDGVEALAVARQSHPDAILSDVLMPRMDGFRLCMAVRQDPALANVPFVLASAVFIDEIDGNLAKDLGANALVLRTPGNAEAFQALVTALASPQPPPRPRAGVMPEEYVQRITAQLDRLAGLNLTVTRRLALYEAQLAILAGMPEMINESTGATVEAILKELLYRCLDPAGVSKGAIYLARGDGEIIPRVVIGFPAPDDALQNLWGRPDVLREVVTRREIMTITAEDTRGGAADLLKQAGAGSFLLVPLERAANTTGVLLVASASKTLGEEWTAFVKAVAHQISQVLALTDAVAALNRLNEDLEKRVAQRTAELRDANDFLETLISLSPSLIFKRDLVHDIGTYSSPNIEWYLGYSRQEVVGTPGFWMAHVHPEDRDGLTAALEQAFKQRQSQVEHEYRFRHQDGSHVWLHAFMRIEYGPGGQPLSLFGYSQDTTSRKVAEEALRHAKVEAERANLAKSEFLSRMSHELRTPLNAILGFAQLLELDSLNDEQQGSVQHILRGGRHLLELINEVLDIARIEAGHMTLSPEPVPLGDALGSLLAMIRPLADEHDVTLAPLPNVGDVHVLADRHRLTQVLLNLLSNAIKYNRPGGTVTVGWALAAGGRVRIAVTDTGVGIRAEEMGRLFVPFMRLASGEGVEGTGIGLALSKGLVELMGGDIGAESEVDRGSTFWVELPAAEHPAEHLAAAPVPIPARVQTKGLSRTILYIEDNLSNLELIKRVLSRRSDVNLITAMQGRLGLYLAREQRPDLILLDVHLPDISGDEILRRLCQAPETRAIPVVVISADATTGQLKRLLALGARGYLTKPLDVKRFLQVLDAVLIGNPTSGT